MSKPYASNAAYVWDQPAVFMAKTGLRLAAIVGAVHKLIVLFLVLIRQIPWWPSPVLSYADVWSMLHYGIWALRFLVAGTFSRRAFQLLFILDLVVLLADILGLIVALYHVLVGLVITVWSITMVAVAAGFFLITLYCVYTEDQIRRLANPTVVPRFPGSIAPTPAISTMTYGASVQQQQPLLHRGREHWR